MEDRPLFGLCEGCGDMFAFTSYRGKPRRYCSKQCRARAAYRSGYISPSRRAECTRCGRQMALGATSSDVIICRECRRDRCPKGHAKADPKECHACRRDQTRRYRAEGRDKANWTPCIDCGKPSCGERCEPCFRRATSRGGTKNSRRLALERAAAGEWSEWRRNNVLLPQWIAEGRACSYCGIAAVEEVDHIVPLARGGTNEIDNLAPACHSCNSIKSDRLLSELGWEVLGDTEVVAPQGRYRGRRGAEA